MEVSEEPGLMASLIVVLVLLFTGTSMLAIYPPMAVLWIALGGVFAALGIRGYYVRTRRLARLRRALAEGRGLCLEPGVVILAYEGDGRYSRGSHLFRSLGAPVCGDPGRALEIAMGSMGFAALVYRRSVYMVAPAARVADECCRGAIVLCAAPGRLEAGAVLGVEAGGVQASAEVVVEGGVYRARLAYMPGVGSSARGARVEVRARPPGSVLSWAVLRLVEAREPGVHEGVRETLPGRPRAVLMGELSGGYAPRVARLLGLGRGVVGYVPGVFEYRVRLVVDLPLRPDAGAEEPLVPRRVSGAGL